MACNRNIFTFYQSHTRSQLQQINNSSPSWEAASWAATQEFLNILKDHEGILPSSQEQDCTTLKNPTNPFLFTKRNINIHRYSDWIRAGRLRGRGSSPGRVKNFHFSMLWRPALGSTQPRIQLVPGVKRPGREADDSPTTSAEVKKKWIYTSTPPYAFMA
jgi:hypothetical protein